MDVRPLKKGDLISIETIERETGISHGDDRWPFALMQMSKYIETQRRNLGMPVTPAIRRGILMILTDSDAARTNARRTVKRIGGMRRDFRRNSEVDIRKLSQEERQKHDREMQRMAFQLQAIKKPRREYESDPIVIAQEQQRRAEREARRAEFNR